MNKLIPICETTDKNEEHLQLLISPFENISIETYVLENTSSYTIFIGEKCEINLEKISTELNTSVENVIEALKSYGKFTTDHILSKKDNPTMLI